MAKQNIFQNSTSTVPRNDSRVVRVPLDEVDIGARKSHTGKSMKKNDYSIEHVKGS